MITKLSQLKTKCYAATIKDITGQLYSFRCSGINVYESALSNWTYRLSTTVDLERFSYRQICRLRRFLLKLDSNDGGYFCMNTIRFHVLEESVKPFDFDPKVREQKRQAMYRRNRW